MLHLAMPCLMPRSLVLLLTVIAIEHADLVGVSILSLRTVQESKKGSREIKGQWSYHVHFFFMAR
jgi:hypothetical protein